MAEKEVPFVEIPTFAINIKKEPDLEIPDRPVIPVTVIPTIHVKQEPPEEDEEIDDNLITIPDIYDHHCITHNVIFNRSEYHRTYSSPKSLNNVSGIGILPASNESLPKIQIKKEIDVVLTHDNNNFVNNDVERKINFMNNLENEIGAFRIPKISQLLRPENLKIKKENIPEPINYKVIRESELDKKDVKPHALVTPLGSDEVETINNNNNVKPESDLLNLCVNQMVNVFMKIEAKPRTLFVKQKQIRNSPTKAKSLIKRLKLEYTGHKSRRDGLFICDLCGRRFGVRQSLVRHVQMPHIEPRAQLTAPLALPCELTPDLIRSELDNLARHGKEVDRKCIICLKSFDRKGCAKRHLLEHVVANCRAVSRYQCPLCDADQFMKVDDFKHHMRVHASLTSYKCRICNKSFGDSSNFSKHKKVHGSTHGQCSMCNRKFRTAKMMELHMEHHKHTKPMKCPKCERIFYFESILKKHLKGAHTQKTHCPKSYKCCTCDLRFDSLKDKWRHQWQVHSVRNKSADCWLCEARFRIITDLRQHLTQNHGLSLTCKKIKLKQNKER